jgi:hypothetical protein
VAILSDKEEGSQSPGHLKIFEPESDGKAAVALSVDSPSENCAVELDVVRRW